MSIAALLLAVKRLTGRRDSQTTITVTRVVGTHPDPETGEPVEDKVIVTTAPEPDTETVRLAQIALIVSAFAAAVAIVATAWHTMRRAVI